MKRDVIEYRLQVNGIFGRNRKEKFETFLLAEIDSGETIEADDLRRLAESKMSEIKVKSGRVLVKRFPVTIETLEDGMVIRGMTISLLSNAVALDLGVI